jgi:hypothetical protein
VEHIGHCYRQRFFAIEVVVERSLRYARGSNNGLHASGVTSAFVEEVSGRVKETLVLSFVHLRAPSPRQTGDGRQTKPHASITEVEDATICAHDLASIDLD